MAGSDFTSLNASIKALTDQVTATQGTEASATTLINNFGATVQQAVTDALTADDAADQGSIQAANEAIAGVTKQFADSAAALGAAVAANPKK